MSCGVTIANPADALISQALNLTTDFLDGLGPHTEVGPKPAVEVPPLVDKTPQGGWLKLQFVRCSLELGEEGMCGAHEMQTSVKLHIIQDETSHSQAVGASRYVICMEVNEVFRLRLKAEMEAQGYNPASLSKRASLNKRAVTDLLESRAQSPKLSTAFALAQALGVGLDELVGFRPQVSIAPRLAELLGQYSEAEQEQLAEAISALPRAPASKP